MSQVGFAALLTASPANYDEASLESFSAALGSWALAGKSKTTLGRGLGIGVEEWSQMESSCERVRIQRNNRAQEFCITAFQKRQIQAAIFQGCRDMEQPPTVSYSQVSLEDSQTTEQ